MPDGRVRNTIALQRQSLLGLGRNPGLLAPYGKMENVKYLLAAGGGGGGGKVQSYGNGGGGGGGDVAQGTLFMDKGVLPVFVGKGGKGGTNAFSNPLDGTNGDPTYVPGLAKVLGGGYGCTARLGALGGDGPTGGGCGVAPGLNAGHGTFGRDGGGPSGGTDTGSQTYVGGGGGAGGPGGNPGPSGLSGQGGVGVTSGITGSGIAWVYGAGAPGYQSGGLAPWGSGISPFNWPSGRGGVGATSVTTDFGQDGEQGVAIFSYRRGTVKAEGGDILLYYQDTQFVVWTVHIFTKSGGLLFR